MDKFLSKPTQINHLHFTIDSTDSEKISKLENIITTKVTSHMLISSTIFGETDEEESDGNGFSEFLNDSLQSEINSSSLVKSKKRNREQEKASSFETFKFELKSNCTLKLKWELPDEDRMTYECKEKNSSDEDEETLSFDLTLKKRKIE